ncbi:hypothetical protein BJ166DRAFT_583206 [Pestalotiopsis sp. NC0098]|nr:hypothetical protein BJ166DRAFT_583206 [Pestalotiopsis sp. NC0098]
MPRLAFFASSSSGSIRRDNAASSAVLSRPAIIGIALGGSFVLFLALSHLFITLGRGRDRRRLAVLQRQAAHAAVGSPVAALDLYESHVSSGGGARKSRLRKKSLLLFGAHSATASDADINANDNNNGQGWPVYEPATLLPPVLPPVFSRQQSYDLYPFLPGSAPPTSHDGASTTRGRDDEFDREESQRLEKQRGRDMYQMRRRSSWIDEDALHGPRVSPKKSGKKQKKQNSEGRRKSWLSGSLTRRLSLKKRRPLSDPVVFGSPTLPHVGPRERERDRPMSLLALPYEMEATSPTRGNSQDSPLKPGQHNTVRIAIPSAVVSAPILPVPKPPSAMINNPRHRGGNSASNNNNNNSVAVGVLNDAAQLLAAREGSSAAASTTNKILAPIPQRPSVPKHSATDSELSEILRMTTERLQDGKRSSRRQTMLIRSRTDGTETLTYEQHSTTTNNTDNMAMMNLTVNVGDSGGRTVSPTKSQKSAPAALACAELEANEVASPGKSCSSSQHPPDQQQGTPKRQHRHSRQMSQVSLASEADSLLTMRGTTYQPEHTTALSSPSRNNVNNVNAKQMYEPTARRENTPQQQQQQPQKARPSSAASSHASSALSTLYSEDEEAAQSSNLQTRMFPLAEPGERPYNPKRGTLGQMVSYGSSSSSRPLPDPRGGADDLHAGLDAWLPRETSLQFTIYPMDHDDNGDDGEDDNDPFTAKAPSPDPVRLSQVFTPIPSSTFDFSTGGGEDIDPRWSNLGDRGVEDPLYPTVRVTKPTTPTPSPKNNNSRRMTAASLVFPPPQNLRPVISSPTLGGRQRQQRQRQPSPAASSVYESYADSERATLDNNNYSTVTVPSNESAALGGGGGGQSSVPRKMGAASYDAAEPRPHVDREASGDSVYSQDQDGDLHDRPGLGLGLGVGLQRDSYHFPRDAAADDEDDRRRSPSCGA